MHSRLAPWLVAAFAAVTLAACKDSPAPAAAPAAAPSAPATAAAPAPAPAPAAAPASNTPTMEALASDASGFSVGAPMSARVAYVFFDPQCPHCAALWEAARPLRTQARMVWIPISLLNPNSAPQGAAMLKAKDPVAAMDGHEASMAAKRGGIVPDGDVEAQKALVKKNTELFDRYKFGSVPTIITKNAEGNVITREGALPTDGLKAFLGIQ